MAESNINAEAAVAVRRVARAVGFFGVANPQDGQHGTRAALADRPSLEQFEDRFSHTQVAHPRRAA